MAMPPPAIPPIGLGGGRGRSMRRAAGDAGVQRTNDDAQATKMSCASLGYFSDGVLPLLARCPPSRKPPLINRGTWARHAAMRQVTTDFVAACLQHAQQQQQQQQQAANAEGGNSSPAEASAGAQQESSSIDSSSSSSVSQSVCQVVSLGAGSDSSWFSLQQQGWGLLPAVHYIELDYQEMVAKKARSLLASEQLLALLPDGTTATTELAGPRYSLVGADLRHLEQLEAALHRAGFDARLPTLYLAECVLIYLEPGEAARLLAAAAARAAGGGGCAAVAIYEQTRPDDAFGATMIANLEARGCPLRSVGSVPRPASQEARLAAAGWAAAAAADMAAVYHGRSSGSGSGSSSGAAGGCGGWLRPFWCGERGRIERLELLDELEEWRLMQEHYCLALGVTGQGCSWLAEGLQLDQLRALGS
ncbi:hypothetical protein OEZ85_005994 [Tetradesmus obliquus]|uniref:Leucine carboxyl methyltransferase 1 homolog n=1 Tax=Tetradesmus obliquus TaxID=3088 RepID=A0ABY8UFI7_TETOB|nr:hypothetical protein OEZ85_005994 [Tetradesmus obliquus]